MGTAHPLTHFSALTSLSLRRPPNSQVLACGGLKRRGREQRVPGPRQVEERARSTRIIIDPVQQHLSIERRLHWQRVYEPTLRARIRVFDLHPAEGRSAISTEDVRPLHGVRVQESYYLHFGPLAPAGIVRLLAQLQIQLSECGRNPLFLCMLFVFYLYCCPLLLDIRRCA